MHTTLHQASQTMPRAQRAAALRFSVGLALTLLGACSAYKPAIPPSEGHINAATVQPPGEKERILPPVTSTTTFTPPPRPKSKATTYSVVVHEVPVKELLLALARDTKENIDIHPGLSGLVSLNAIDETLPSILERIAKQVNVRYRVDGRTIVVEPDTPYFKTYRVNYVNMTRDASSTISVSGQVGTGTAGAESGGTSSTSVKTSSKSDFWEVLRKNVDSILAASRKLDQSATERQARAERAKAQREQQLAQAEAVARAGPNATNLFKEVFGGEALDDKAQEIVINPIAGTMTVLATERQHSLVQQYLDSVQISVQRQVMIEATIAEVQLSQNYQAGIDWQQLANNGNGFRFQQQVIDPGALLSPARVVLGYGIPGITDFNVSIRLLEQFGNTRVLSSPKLMALNNQTALLKVVDNVVYFTVQSQISQGTVGNGNLQSVTTTPNTVAVGVVVSLTPQVHEDGNVTLTVRPTISRVLRFIPDPNPAISGANNQGVPEIAVREMESVLQLTSGQTAILGGLMQDNVKRDRNQVPYAGNLPRVGDLFAYRNEAVTKSELVIFIRPIVVNNPSLDSEELKHLRRLLPEIDKTGDRP